MKITTFNPSIITKDAEETIKLFKDLGFEQTHNKAENVDVEFSAHRMKDANGFHVDVVEVPSIPQTYPAIRIRRVLPRAANMHILFHLPDLSLMYVSISRSMIDERE